MSDVKLYKGDCLELMKNIVDKSVDLICTDIPYELAPHGGTNCAFAERVIRMRDSVEFIANGIDYDKVFSEFIRVCKIPNMIIFCSNLQIGKIISFFSAKELKTDLLVWEKSNPAPLCNGKYISDLEYIIYVHDKGSPFNNAVPIEWKRKCKVYPIMVDKDKLHPTQKPQRLMTELVMTHSFENQVVLDPFMGSGTTGAACVLNKRNFIGIEKEDEYFNIAKDRLENPETYRKIRECETSKFSLF